MMKPRQGRHGRKMSLLTELEILGDGFLQRWRAYVAGVHLHIGCPPRANAFLGGDGAINLFRRRGNADAMDEVGGHKLFKASTTV